VLSLANIDGDMRHDSWVDGVLNGEVLRLIMNGMAMKVEELEHVRYVFLYIF
jgi:hypothetical protein